MSFQRRAASELGRRDHARWLGSSRYAGGAPLTLPTTNLLAAYDARVGVTNVSGACSAWADQSGNGYHASQGTAGARPTISTSDGYASLLFDGTADWLSVPSMALSAGGTRTVYSVVKQVATSGTRIVFYVGSTPVFYCGHQTNYIMYDGTFRDSGIALNTAMCRLTFEATAGASQVWRDGTAGTARGYSTLPAASGTRGIGGAGGDYFSGHILAIFIYEAARNTAVEAYITQEWGV